MDFLKPAGVNLPPEDRGSEIANLQPEIDSQPEISRDIIPATDQEEIEVPEIPKITESDLGDLDISPGLAEYRDFASQNSPERLFELSSTLRARGQFQRALLAIERVIDTCKAGPEALSEAAQGIAALSPTLPRWTVDPTSESSLKLHLGTTKSPSDPLKKAILDVALLIRESSGDQLDIIPTINSREDPDAPENNSIALWLTSTAEEPTSSAVITLRLSDNEAEFFPEISRAVFKAIRSHLTSLGYPDQLDSAEPGRDLLSFRITRLMWRDFARSLQTVKKPPAAEDPEGSSEITEQD